MTEVQSGGMTFTNNQKDTGNQSGGSGSPAPQRQTSPSDSLVNNSLPSGGGPRVDDVVDGNTYGVNTPHSTGSMPAGGGSEALLLAQIDLQKTRILADKDIKVAASNAEGEEAKARSEEARSQGRDPSHGGTTVYSAWPGREMDVTPGEAPTPQQLRQAVSELGSGAKNAALVLTAARTADLVDEVNNAIPPDSPTDGFNRLLENTTPHEHPGVAALCAHLALSAAGKKISKRDWFLITRLVHLCREHPKADAGFKTGWDLLVGDMMLLTVYTACCRDSDNLSAVFAKVNAEAKKTTPSSDVPHGPLLKLSK